MGNSVISGFQIPKIGDVCGRSTAASNRIMKWMAPGDSAQRIGLVRYPLGKLNGRGSISMWGVLGSQDCEF